MNKTILGTIIATLLAGGAAGGYKVILDREADIFENSVHEVVYVVDGDTIDIEDGVRIRLLGIDAPERDECFGEEAWAYMEELLLEQHIRIEKDITGSDRYDRLLRYVYIPADDPAKDDVFVQDHVVREGYAVASGEAPDNRYRDLLVRAEEEARESGRGLWGACAYERDDSADLREKDSLPPGPVMHDQGKYFREGVREAVLSGGVSKL